MNAAWEKRVHLNCFPAQPWLDNLNWNNCYNISKFAGGGDNLSNHPNREQIIKKLTEILNNHRHKIKPRFKEENGNWKGGKTFCKCGNRINSNSFTCAKCQDKTGINNPFYNKQHSEETKNKISEKNKKRGYVGNQEKSVIINNIEYQSVSNAARKLNVTPNTIINRIRNKKFPEYSYKNEYLTTIETACSETGEGSRVESSDSKRKQP